ncbi:MAG TPA: zinc-binding dehydrogenase, partial [Pseudomonadales bacterium]|nr:zinc-binding dehydrogenase [Pseudomonadales bacterium]
MQTAIEIQKPGGVEQIQVVQKSIPMPQADEVLIRVEATGVAFADVVMREGLYPEVPAKALTPGYDVVGVIERVGAKVTDRQPGERVLALTRTGGYAQFALAKAALLVPCPVDIPAAEAVALVLNYVTAYQMLVRIARVRAGDCVLVHGPTGGVGEALVQFGNLFGCKVYGTVSQRKLQQLANPPGFIPLHYQQQPFEKVLKEMEPDGVDAVFDAIGGHHLKRSYEALSQGGKVVTYGMSTAIENGRRNLLRALSGIARSLFVPVNLLADSKGVHGYNIWNLANAKPEWFQQDLQR